jgi:hypothetical protein
MARQDSSVQRVDDEHMGKLIYSMNVSIDGFVETPDRSIDWAIVDEEGYTAT